MPVNSVTLRRSVEQFADLLQRRADATAIRQETTTLSATLIGSAVRRLAGAKRLIIVPDRYLHAVPFAALVNPATGALLPGVLFQTGSARIVTTTNYPGVRVNAGARIDNNNAAFAQRVGNLRGNSAPSLTRHCPL